MSTACRTSSCAIPASGLHRVAHRPPSVSRSPATGAPPTAPAILHRSARTAGRYVAFASTATNLVPGDTNGVQDIFVRDTCATVPSGCTPATSRVSVATDGSQGSLFSSAPSISGDGRFVAFLSDSILVLGDINAVSDAFIRDTCTGAAGCTPSTMRVSMASEARAQNLGILPAYRPARLFFMDAMSRSRLSTGIPCPGVGPAGFRIATLMLWRARRLFANRPSGG